MDKVFSELKQINSAAKDPSFIIVADKAGSLGYDEAAILKRSIRRRSKLVRLFYF